MNRVEDSQAGQIAQGLVLENAVHHSTVKGV
jgi:hypothetical protein